MALQKPKRGGRKKYYCGVIEFDIMKYDYWDFHSKKHYKIFIEDFIKQFIVLGEA